jgi:PST family polysaccharide transporter
MTAVRSGADKGGGLGGVLKHGALMSAIGLVLCQVVTVAQMIVMGRLLGPAEVGIYVAGSVAIGVLLVTHGALSQALVQREGEIEDAANTVLVVTFATGLLLSLGVLVASPLIGYLFHDARVGLFAAATSGLVLLRSCSNVPDALMQRSFRFKARRIFIDPAVAVVSAAASILFAVLGYGAWAMVIGAYMSALTWVVMSWWLAGWRPFRGRVSFRIWREMARFSWPLLLDGVAERAREFFEQVLIGRSLGTEDLGQYRYAYRIASLPSLAVIQVCGFVLFPAFSRIAGDAERFREAFLRALGWIWFAALPCGALLVVVGQPLVVLLLGEEWRSAGAATAAMAGIGLGTALISVGWEAIKGAGRSTLLNWITALSLGLGPGLILLLLPFGLIGVGLAISTTYLLMGCVSVVLGRSVVGASTRDTVAALAPPTGAALIAFAAAFPLERAFLHSDKHAALLGLASVVMVCLLFTLVYLAMIRVFSPTRFRAVHAAVERGLVKVRGMARRHG